jgi:hypothetical protein
VTLRGGIVVDTTHVIVEVPSPGESIAWHGTFTALPQTEVGVISVSMESVGLTLVAEEASVRREAELGINAGRGLAAVGLQVGVQVLAVWGRSVSWGSEKTKCQAREDLLVGAFLRGGWVATRLFSGGEGTVILSIAVGGHGVVVVLPRVASLDTFLGALANLVSHGERLEELWLDLGLGSWKS